VTDRYTDASISQSEERRGREKQVEALTDARVDPTDSKRWEEEG